jgi:hypothetical protein
LKEDVFRLSLVPDSMSVVTFVPHYRFCLSTSRRSGYSSVECPIGKLFTRISTMVSSSAGKRLTVGRCSRRLFIIFFDLDLRLCVAFDDLDGLENLLLDRLLLLSLSSLLQSIVSIPYSPV